MDNSVLEITNSNGNELGTGFIIKTDNEGAFIATCGHVVKNFPESILVNQRPATIIANEYENGLDLSILYVKNMEGQALKLSLHNGQDVKVIGYSKILGKSKKESIFNIKTKENVLISSTKSLKLYPKESISEGYSGSPVICEITNNVVGIVCIKSGEENYAISSEYISKMMDLDLEENKKNSKVKLKTQLENSKAAIIKSKLEDNLNQALSSFSSQKNIWVTPHIDSIPEEKNAHSEEIDLTSIIKHPCSTIIKYRPQYGATSLSHFFISEAWNQKEPSYWLYLDASDLKPHKKEIEKSINKKLNDFGLQYDDIECVILDEFSTTLENSNRLLKELNEYLNNKTLIIMQSIDENPLVDNKAEFPIEFKKLYLWPLDRKRIRTLVNNYNSVEVIEEDTRVLNKVVNDLEALNIPRTPQNCLTILKISEFEFDDSPVNRAEMISRVLHLLFNIDDIPHYKTRPDLKDTEFTLGYFCEDIIKSKNMFFSRDSFIEKLSRFCKENEIDLEVSIIFDILYKNSIIVFRNDLFCFKFTYWIYYFSAHRMLHDSEFSKFILSNKKYLECPEIIEFYTGIDRRRGDAVKIIINDLNSIEDIVNKKCNLPEDFDIYKIAKWLPSRDQLKNVEKEIISGISSSSLPDEIKDEYADRDYSRTKPLTQNLLFILEEYSLLRLIQGIKAGSLALRNSDFIEKELKHELLDSVLKSIKQMTNVLVAISPILTVKNHANIEGAHFSLSGSFSEEPEEKLNEIISCLPSNMIDFFADQLFSQKMGTLIHNKISQEEDAFKKHYLNLVVIAKRPKKWEDLISQYILSVDKNSFYLLDTINALKSEYKYSYASEKNIEKIGDLIKLCTGKHASLLKKPSVKKAQNLSDKILPKRLV